MRYLLICLLLAACGGGGDYSEVKTDDGETVTTAGVCEFASREDAERALDAGVLCRLVVYGTVNED